jgi:RNA-binding protein NOB1
MAFVLDTGVFIKGTNLKAIGEHLYSIPEVIAEVRDKAARNNLMFKLDEVVLKSPNEEDIQDVVNFARKTGDIRSLSATDIKVIALAVRLEKERNGGKSLRSEPINIRFNSASHKRKPAAETTLPQTLSERVIEEESEQPDTLQASGSQTQEADQIQQPSDSTQQDTEAEPEEQQNEAEGQEQGDELPDHIEDEDQILQPESTDPQNEQESEDSDSGDDWITPENYGVRASDGRASVVTIDFAMQNVVLQIGLRLVSVGGVEIRNIKRWVLKCRSCFKILDEVEKEFCPDCGSHTLYKISYSVDSSGNVRYHEPRNRKLNLRGKIVSYR